MECLKNTTKWGPRGHEIAKLVNTTPITWFMVLITNQLLGLTNQLTSLGGPTNCITSLDMGDNRNQTCIARMGLSETGYTDGNVNKDTR